MATYETTITIPRPVEETFGFVSNFHHAVHWDPRTYSAEKVTDGPVGVGTRFVLRGGALRQDLLQRLHIPARLAGSALPYEVVEFDPPRRFVLEGQSALYRYTDRLDFESQGSDVTLLRYEATLELRGPMALADVILRPVFRKIGEDATRHIAEAVAQGI
jgi:dehydrogenase/reductase SDR family protein 12